MEEKKLFLLDAYALIYRAYYALIRAPRVTSKGMNTSAVFGFCNTLDEVLRKEKPQYIAVCFDPAGSGTFRHEMYPEYKAQREKQPEDITVAVPYIKRILQACNIPVIEMERYEADDVIGTLAWRASDEGFTTYMMTPDKDYGQLVRDNVLMYRPPLAGKGFEVRGPKEICERYGISDPRQVIDLLALEGDASDNIPGCPGVGEKTASKLISEWGSVENLLDHASDLKGALRKKIEDNAGQIRFSKVLATIKTDVPVDVQIEDLVRREPDVDALAEVYRELEFRTFLARLNADGASADTAPPAPPQAPGFAGSLFDTPGGEAARESTVAAAYAALPTSYTEVADLALLARAIDRALQCDAVGVAADARGEEAMTATLCGIALSFGDSENVYIPLQPKGFGREETLAVVAPLFAGKATIVCHDVKRCMILLRRENVDFSCAYYDTSVAHYVLKPEMKHTPDYISLDILGHRTITCDIPDAEQRRMAQDTAHAKACVCEKARVALALRPELERMIADRGQTQLVDEIEMPLVEVLASMEWEGARVDVAELHRLSASLTARVSELEQRAYALAGHPFNVGSPSQVGEILFGEMAIDPKAKKTKRGAWSTTEEILEKFRHQYEIVDLILKIRALRKLLATYIDALPRLINPSTGKIHTTYNQTVTATGRISSTNPNLQNIPIRTDDGREIRKAFIPDPGCLLLSADYSQIELRLMADFSGDSEMVAAFASGEDIHRSTAAKIYHIPIGEVSDNQRRHAKTANFGIIYGISAFGLSQRLDIPRSEAKMLIDGYLATYPGVKQYMDKAIADAREKGYVTTIMGRKRYLPDINSRNATVRGYAERNAINAPLQGSAADIIKIAMIRIYGDIIRKGLQSRMILQVHDELIFNVAPGELAQLQEIVVRDMVGAYSGGVAMEVSAGTGSNWLEAH